MPPHPAPLRLAAAAVLPLLAGAASAAPSRPAAATLAVDPGRDSAAQAAVLAAAQDRAARAGASVDDLRRELSPGHLTDPMPDADRAFGLSSLRSDYADAQRRAAGYRATLGDQHPTLRATEQMMDDLRAQLLAGTRRALASAEHDAAEARADVAAAERRLAAPVVAAPAAVPAPDPTGSVPAPARRAASPLSLPPAAATPAKATPASAGPAADAGPRPIARRPVHLLLLAAAAALAALFAAWGALRLLRTPRAAPAARDPHLRRAGAPPARARRVEPAMALPPAAAEAAREAEARAAETPAPGAPPAVPVLGRLPLPDAAAPRGDALAGLHATLRAAFGDGAPRMTVLVAAAAGLHPVDADAAAFALACASAAAGRRPLLMEARPCGRLRGALAPAGAVAAAIEAGGAVRTLYRVGPAGAVALLPSDPGEAEAAALAAARPGAPRLRGFDGFDTVVLVGDDAAALAGSADLILVAAPADAASSALEDSARPLRAAGRPCGALLVATAAEPTAALASGEPVLAATPHPAAAHPAAAHPAASRSTAAPRRRAWADPAPAVRLGLRGSFDPARRRAG